VCGIAFCDCKKIAWIEALADEAVLEYLKEKECKAETEFRQVSQQLDHIRTEFRQISQQLDHIQSVRDELSKKRKLENALSLKST
jgi:hypothetical protein